MTYPMKDIKEITITKTEVTVIYNDTTKMTIKIQEEIKFIKDYINPNDSPITDHCQ